MYFEIRFFTYYMNANVLKNTLVMRTQLKLKIYVTAVMINHD